MTRSSVPSGGPSRAIVAGPALRLNDLKAIPLEAEDGRIAALVRVRELKRLKLAAIQHPTEAEREVIELYQSGLTAKEVATRVRVTQAVVYGALKRNNVPRRVVQPPHALRDFDDYMVPTLDGCHQWIGGSSMNGYGNYQNQGAHRHAWERQNGPIPSGLHIHHRCGNRNCVNPMHLEMTTARAHLAKHGSVVGQNIRKTHCKRGHEFTPANIYRVPGTGKRACITCKRTVYRYAKPS